MVRLLLTETLPHPADTMCFNPTMVRLLPGIPTRIASVSMLSIPQWCDCCNLLIEHLHQKLTAFNPTMVRLLPGIPTRIASVSMLSIPQWCDCCKLSHTTSNAIPLSFNPTMVRLLHNCDKNRQNCVKIFQYHNGAIAAFQAPHFLNP